MKLLSKFATLFLIGCAISLIVIVAITQMQPMGDHRIEALYAMTVYVALFGSIPITAFSLIITTLAVTMRRNTQKQFTVALLTTLLIPLAILLILKAPGTTMKTTDRAFATLFVVKYLFIPALCCCLSIVFTTRKLFRPNPEFSE